MKLPNINITSYLKHLNRGNLLILTVELIKVCCLVVVFIAGYGVALEYVKQFTLLNLLGDIFAHLFTLIVLGCITIILSISSIHFFTNVGRILDSITYFVATKLFTHERVEYKVAIDLYGNYTSKIRFAKQTLIFIVLFAFSFLISYHLTTEGASNKLASNLKESVFLSEKQIKHYQDSSKVAINSYYDSQIATIRKTTNFSLEIAEEKQRNIALLLQEKQTSLKDLQDYVKELRSEQKTQKDKENTLNTQTRVKGKVIGGVFEFIVVICSLIVQVLNPKQREPQQQDNYSPIQQPFTSNVETVKTPFKNETENEIVNEINENESFLTAKDLQEAKENIELVKCLMDRLVKEERNEPNLKSFGEISRQFNKPKHNVTNLYYKKIKPNKHIFENIVKIRGETIIDNYELNGQITWKNNA